MFFAALAVVVAMAAPAHAANVVWVGGTKGSLGTVLSGLFSINDELLGGAYQDDDFTTVDYPGGLWPITGVLDPTLGVSVGIGVTNTMAAIATLSGQLVVAGTSQGSLVVQQVEANLNSNPAVPDNTTFILIADPNLGLFNGSHGQSVPVFDYVPFAVPETRFKTIIVVNQYDFFADPITQPWNLLTDLNALVGIYYVHSVAQATDLSTVPPQNITTTTNSQGGTTTVYRVPTTFLPLTMPLRQWGVPAGVVDAIDAQLRPIIDQGYAPVSSTRPPVAASPAAQLVSRTASSGRQRPTTPPAVKGAASTGAFAGHRAGHRDRLRDPRRSRRAAPAQQVIA